MQKVKILFLSMLISSSLLAQTTATFEDFNLTAGQFLNGSDGSGGLTSIQLEVAMGIVNEFYANANVEFFIFDDIRFDQNEHSGYYFLDSVEGRWNSGRDEGPNLGYKPRYKEGYFPVPPTDSLVDLRAEQARVRDVLKGLLPEDIVVRNNGDHVSLRREDRVRRLGRE